MMEIAKLKDSTFKQPKEQNTCNFSDQMMSTYYLVGRLAADIAYFGC